MDQLFAGTFGAKVRGAVLVVLAALAAFLVLQAAGSFMGLRYIGAGIMPTNTITVSGEGEAYAKPDIGEFSYTVVSEKKTVDEAQSDAASKTNEIMSYLKDADVEDKDIKTIGYSVNPQYDYQSAVCPAVSSTGGVAYCPSGKRVLRGYEVRQTTQVKVRDTDKAGELLAGIGERGATEMSGLSFTVEDPDAVEAEARGKAIEDAQLKAERLARQLGVSLVRVVSFSENGGGYPMPMVYGMGGDMMSVKSSVPEIAVGENRTASNVSITFEIR